MAGNVLGMGREHWSQNGLLMIAAGTMIASATYFIVDHIDTVAAQAQASAMAMDRRVTTLEAYRASDSMTINHLSTLLDQDRAAEEDLALSIRGLEAAIKTRR